MEIGLIMKIGILKFLKILDVILIVVLFIFQIRILTLHGIQYWDGILVGISGPLWEENTLPIIFQFIGLGIYIISIVFVYRLEFRRSLIVSCLGFILFLIPDIAQFSIQSNIISHQLGMNSEEFNFLLKSFNPISNTISVLVYIFLITQILIFISQFIESAEDKIKVKKQILKLGTKFTRLQVKEIAEKCKVNHSMIIRIAKEMINNKEIYAEYFKSSKSVVFNQQANIDEIDKLMKIYKDWEEEKFEKK